MKYYFAPLEGITGYIYRRIHHFFYPGIDKYFTPFIVPKDKRDLSTKERNDVSPMHNKGMLVVPQIMTNKASDFLRIANTLYKEYGYQEVNLNLGCPSKTVVSKRRGAGFLAVPDKLETFLEDVCDGLTTNNIRLSIKTRIGKEDTDEFVHLLDIYRKYPLSELIVHPRLQSDFYQGLPNFKAFSQAYELYLSGCSKKEKEICKLCYNGNIFSMEDYLQVYQKFPQINAVMLGRGLLTNPRLVQEIKLREKGGIYEIGEQYLNIKRFACEAEEEAERKRRFEMYLYLQDDYLRAMSGEIDVLYKMKELWIYMGKDFTEPEDYLKKMKKTQKLDEFKKLVQRLCTEQKLRQK